MISSFLPCLSDAKNLPIPETLGIKMIGKIEESVCIHISTDSVHIYEKSSNLQKNIFRKIPEISRFSHFVFLTWPSSHRPRWSPSTKRWLSPWFPRRRRAWQSAQSRTDPPDPPICAAGEVLPKPLGKPYKPWKMAVKRYLWSPVVHGRCRPLSH